MPRLSACPGHPIDPGVDTGSAIPACSQELLSIRDDLTATGLRQDSVDVNRAAREAHLAASGPSAKPGEPR